MSKTLKHQIVEKARALIEDERHWCRGELARDMNALSVCPTDTRAVRRCALGALIAAAYQIINDLSRAHDQSSARKPARRRPSLNCCWEDRLLEASVRTTPH